LDNKRRNVQMVDDDAFGILTSLENWLSEPTVIIGAIGLIIFTLISLGGKILMSVWKKSEIIYLETKEAEKPSFTIVVPTFNEGKAIIEKISRLSKLDYPPELLEVIFVDSSDDGTFQLIEDGKSELPFHSKVVFSHRDYGLSGALDLAYSSSISDIVMKSDCDIVMDSGILKSFARAFSDESVGAVSACGRVSDSRREKFEDGYRKLKLNDRMMESRIHSTHIFDTVAAIRRELYTGISPGITADDAELAIQAIRSGKRAILVPDANFVETLPTGKILRKIKYRRAGAHLKLLFQNIDMIFSKEFGQYSKYIFPRIFALMTVCPFLFITSVVSLLLSFGSGEYWDILTLIVGTIVIMMLISPKKMVLAVSVAQVQIDLFLGLFFMIINRKSLTWEASR